MNDVPLQHLEEAVAQALEEQPHSHSVLSPSSDDGPIEIMKTALFGVFAESIAPIKQEVLDAVDAALREAGHKTERMQRLLSAMEAQLREAEDETEKRTAAFKAEKAKVRAEEAELMSQLAAFALEKALFESRLPATQSQGVVHEQRGRGGDTSE